MGAEVMLTFKISKSAFEILKLVRSQNASLNFELDDIEGSLILVGNMLDFPVYADDWGKEEIEKYMEGVD